MMAATASRAESPNLPRKLLDEALRLNVGISGRSEDEVRRAVREAWIEENREAIQASNAWVEKHGLPLAKYRQF
jgi:antitoxin CcdA